MVKAKEKKELEQMIEELESIVKKLEADSHISLDASINYFEEGVELYKKCKVVLSEAEKKIKVLTDSLKEEDLKLDN